eukprot:758392-Hanusia_phi.AAC.2
MASCTALSVRCWHCPAARPASSSTDARALPSGGTGKRHPACGRGCQRASRRFALPTSAASGQPRSAPA